MECYLEQVLYRDLRTIRTTTKEDDDIKESRLSYKSLTFFHQFGSRSLSKNSVVSNQSSLPSNHNCFCHNQYFLRNERLHLQTEDNDDRVRFGCEEVSCSWTGKATSVNYCSSNWSFRLNKLHYVLLLSTYLFILVLPNVSAVPTTISSRRTLRNLKSYNQMALPDQDNLIAVLTTAYRDADSALINAKHLKNLYRQKVDIDPVVTYNDVPAYEWLPRVPSPFSEYFEEQLRSSTLREIARDIYKQIQIIRVPVELLSNDTECWGNFSVMRGLLDNMIEELNFTLGLDQGDYNSVMPDELKNMDKTGRATRDWLFIRSLVDVLEYAVAVFKHYGIPLNK
ncbi:hypothetical protein ABEB36_000337 [Hypothenemus hampei]|uniref:Uncharacterized protein n=1 Tax=Hypothenemus hampei TaxID=57062 RepID=A0ABD1FAV2_HYPHA